ncbi:MAG: hypothetical protein AB1629_01770 [Candidatus Omnitrophota bacterium]
MPKNKFLFILSFLFASILAMNLTSYCYAQNREELTITTYYPAPFGVYRQLRLFPRDDINLLNPCNNGDMFYRNTDNQFYFCTNGSWQAGGGGLWRLDNPFLYPNDLNWRVGIGTATPSAGLHVNGTFRITNPIPAGMAPEYFGMALDYSSHPSYGFAPDLFPMLTLSAPFQLPLVEPSALRIVVYESTYGNIIYSYRPPIPITGEPDIPNLPPAPNLGGRGLGIAGGGNMAPLPRFVVNANDMFLGYSIQPGDGALAGGANANGNLYVRGKINDVSFTDPANTTLDPAFIATSVVGALNELRQSYWTGAGWVAITTNAWDQTVNPSNTCNMSGLIPCADKNGNFCRDSALPDTVAFKWTDWLNKWTCVMGGPIVTHAHCCSP